MQQKDLESLSNEELVDKVIAWAQEREIFKSSTPLKQAYKIVAELGEVFDCLAKEESEKLKVEIGDVVVTIILFAAMNGIKYKIVEHRQNAHFQNALYREELTLLMSLSEGLMSFISSRKQPMARFVVDLKININNLCLFHKVKQRECLELALVKISNRSTRMVNGVAVKD